MGVAWLLSEPEDSWNTYLPGIGLRSECTQVICKNKLTRMKINLPCILLFASLLGACSGHKTFKSDLMGMGLNGKVKSLTETSYYAIASAGALTKGKQGEQDFPWSESRYDFNTEGNFLTHNAYNPDGSLVFQQLYKYNGKGLKIEATYYYRLGTDSLRERTVYKYDSAGKLTDLKTYDLIGLLDRRFAYKYDNAGNLTETYSYDYDDNIDSTSVNRLDSHGNCIETTIRNADSSLKNKSTSTYDDKGNKLVFNLYNADGSLRYKSTYKYDKKGKKTEFAKYVSDSLVEKQIFLYDKNEILTGQEVFKADGRLETKLTFEYVFDNQNNWIKRTELNFNIPKYIVERTIKYY